MRRVMILYLLTWCMLPLQQCRSQQDTSQDRQDPGHLQEITCWKYCSQHSPKYKDWMMLADPHMVEMITSRWLLFYPSWIHLTTTWSFFFFQSSNHTFEKIRGKQRERTESILKYNFVSYLLLICFWNMIGSRDIAVSENANAMINFKLDK